MLEEREVEARKQRTDGQVQLYGMPTQFTLHVADGGLHEIANVVPVEAWADLPGLEPRDIEQITRVEQSPR